MAPLDDPVCICGHTLDEHKTGFFQSCTVEGCECLDFELQQTEPDEEDD